MRKVIKGNVNLNNLYLTELFDLSDVEVIGGFYCSDNNLTSLKGAPKAVRNSPFKFKPGNFYCHNNQLTNLEGAPITVDHDFYCHNSKLISLEGGPKSVGIVDKQNGKYSCVGNNLSDLEGAPESVGWHFECYNNPFTSLKGIPKYIGGDFVISYSLIDDFPKKYIRSLSNIKGKVQYVNLTEYIN